MTSQPYQPTPPPLCRATHVAPLNASPTKLWTAMSVRGRHCEVSRWLFKVTPALLLVYMNEQRQECWGRRTGGCGQSHKPRSYLTTTDSRTLVPVPYVWPSSFTIVHRTKHSTENTWGVFQCLSPEHHLSHRFPTGRGKPPNQTATCCYNL